MCKNELREMSNVQVMFVYEGHRVKVEVAGAKKVKKSLFLLCKTSISNNFGSIKQRAMEFACSVGFGYDGLSGVTAIFVT